MNSNRICAVNRTSQSMSLLLFIVYIPCDVRSNDDMYYDILSEIVSVYNITSNTAPNGSRMLHRSSD